MALEFYLAELSELDKPIVVSQLANFSDLSSDEIAHKFHRDWEMIEDKRRREVIQRLVDLAEEDAKLNFDNVFRACLKDPDPLVRAKAIEGLKECEDCRLIATLIDLLNNDNEELVRLKAATALGKFTLLTELSKLPSHHLDRIVQALFKIIESRDEAPQLRCRAIEAIAPVNSPRIKTTIFQAYSSGDAEVKISAIRAMGKSGDIKWLPIVLWELENHDPSIVLEAIKSCGELGEATAIPHLLKLVDNADPQTQLSAVKAIAEIGGGESRQALLRLLPHPQQIIRGAAERAWNELEL
jgi:serine/threonine-protein kinase